MRISGAPRAGATRRLAALSPAAIPHPARVTPETTSDQAAPIAYQQAKPPTAPNVNSPTRRPPCSTE
jgi:hypothetical protein